MAGNGTKWMDEMLSLSKTRGIGMAAAFAALCVCSVVATAGGQRRIAPPRPQQFAGGRSGEQVQQQSRRQGNDANAHPQKEEHLAEWMNQHNNLTLEQQQQALEREPGFHEYPQATQQRLHERLNQLNAMSPQQRQKLLAHNEAMERLTPDQRAQVRGAMQQLGTLPPEQRSAVARSFRQLRDLPPDQRMAALNGDRYRAGMNDAQRSTLVNLLRVEPMLPPPEPNTAATQGMGSHNVP